MASTNSNLRKSKKIKNDEFYTRYEDIENELQHYKDFLKNKIVYCNCDNFKYSNFWKYFIDNFHALQLKKVIATHCNIDGKSSWVVSYDGVNLSKNKLVGNGDFRNQECINILNTADVVITNPPFSLFYEYISQLINYKKFFLVIGNMNAVTNKKFFPYIQNNKIWFGITRYGTGNMWFAINDETPVVPGQKIINGVKYQDIGNSAWFTNIENIRHQTKFFDSSKEYPSYFNNKDKYKFYDNYKAINIDKVKDIPYDYYEIMGVPVTFLSKYNSSEFKILGCFNHYDPKTALDFQKYGEAVSIENSKGLFRGPVVNGKAKYFRILIQRLK